MAKGRLQWIPPAPLVAGQLAHGLSWLLLLVLAAARPFALGLPALGWLHLVVLGWLTMTALAVLVHVIPTFTDEPWKGQRYARASLLPYGVGVALLVGAFWFGAPAVLPWAAALIALALLIYLIAAGRTLVAAFAQPPREAAIARALSVTLASLAVTVLFGVGLAWMLSGRGMALPAYAPPIHASFGIIGWLTVLIMGVSTRTVRPITGAGLRHPAIHIVVGTLESGGVVVALAGVMLGTPLLVWIAILAVVAGALIYAWTLADVLRRATVTHRPPQAFIGAAALWLVAGMGLMVGTFAGEPWGAAAIYLLVIGWIAQMVNGHIHHLGIRLIATMARGDDDETPPSELLASALSWTSFGLFQAAVLTGGLALLLNVPELLTAAAVAGFAGWIALGANGASAARRARQPGPPADPLTISLL